MEQIDHMGVEERIFFEEKDWSKEFEDLKNLRDPFNDSMRTEEILSVSEQVSNVMKFRNLSPEERLFQLMTRSFDPFRAANFNER